MAKCRDMDPDQFVIYDVTPRGIVDIDPPDEVKRVCVDCPVRRECLEYAQANRVHGWWAGTNREERAALRRERV